MCNGKSKQERVSERSHCKQCSRQALETRRGAVSAKRNVIATACKDKKVVHFISTQSNPTGNDTVNCKQHDGTIIQVPSVPVVKSNNMGEVDLHDQLCGYYAIRTKSRKWWHYHFWFCVDLSIVSSFILEKKAINHHTRMQLPY